MVNYILQGYKMIVITLNNVNIVTALVYTDYTWTT